MFTGSVGKNLPEATINWLPSSLIYEMYNSINLSEIMAIVAKIIPQCIMAKPS